MRATLASRAARSAATLHLRLPAFGNDVRALNELDVVMKKVSEIVAKYRYAFAPRPSDTPRPSLPAPRKRATPKPTKICHTLAVAALGVGPRTDHQDERLPELDTFEREVDYELTAQV